MPLSKRSLAEFIGTFWLVFGGCGSAVLAAAFPSLGIGFLGVALAFGLTVLTMAFAIGHISGCHLNPAVSVGLVVGKRFPFKELWAYVAAQLAGAIVASGVLYVIASGRAGFDLSGGFASNGYGAHSPGGYSLVACLVAEPAGGIAGLMGAGLTGHGGRELALAGERAGGRRRQPPGPRRAGRGHRQGAAYR